jgi:hypothetical protein
MKLLRVLLATAVFLAAQGGREIPPEPDKNHPNASRWCQRDDGGGWIHNCSCKGMADEHGAGMCNDDGSRAAHGDPKCKNYCLRSRCNCHVECNNPTD